MSVELSIDRAKLSDIISRLSSAGSAISSNSVLQQIAQQVIDQIRILTFSGRDYEGRLFKPYEKRYGSRKKSNVNLYSLATGNHMLNDMTKEVMGNDAVRVLFQTVDKAKLAFWHNSGAGDLPERKFFAVGSKLRSNIYQNYNNVVQATIKRYKLA